MSDELAAPAVHSTEPVPTAWKICSESFPSKLQLRAHARTCKPPFTCRSCETVFPSARLMAAHEMTHRRFTCHQCDTAPFYSSGALEDLARIAHASLIPCPHCENKFGATHNRDKHVRKLHDKEVQSCACGQEFRDAAVKDEHELTCVVSRPGATIAIKRRFSELCEQDGDRNMAIATALREVRDEAAQKLVLRCCGVLYASPDSLRRHKQKKHRE